MISTRERSKEREIMDDFTLEGVHLRDNLDILATINKWLGGNRISLKGVERLVAGQSKDQEIVIVDLGCGNGDMLRRVARLGGKLGYNFKLIGVDANQDTIKYAEELSVAYKNITYLQLNIFSEAFQELEYDIALLTLFLHHLDDKELIYHLNWLKKQTKLGIVVNDLHRSKLAYCLFYVVSLVFNNKIVRNDGLTSILRSFKKSELENYAKEIKVKSEISWRWAFRFRWIMYTKI